MFKVFSSKPLQEAIYDTLHSEQHCVYECSCVLTNPDTEYEFETQYVTQFVIAQDYVNSYTDKSWIKIEISMKEYRELLENMQGLECKMILRSVGTIDRYVREDEEEFMYECKAFLPDQPDIDKVLNANTFGSIEEGNDMEYTQAQLETKKEVSIHLINEDVYNMRHTPINAKFNDTNLEDVAHWVCSQLGATKVNIIPPDNKQVYSNLMIPPMHDISTLFPYLQERYGIYAKGLGYYYTNETMYMYPINDYTDKTSPDKTIINIYNGPSNYLQGLECYHKYEDEMLHIVSITETDTENPSTVYSENTGNTHMAIAAEGMRDRFATIGKDGKVTRSSDDVIILTKENKAPDMSKDMQNINYIGETSNIYKSTSNISKHDTTIVRTTWIRAMPGIIMPGQNVLYHFDNKSGEYMVQKGRIMKAMYTGIAKKSDPINNWITFNCVMECSLFPDQITTPV